MPVTRVFLNDQRLINLFLSYHYIGGCLFCMLGPFLDVHEENGGNAKHEIVTGILVENTFQKICKSKITFQKIILVPYHLYMILSFFR